MLRPWTSPQQLPIQHRDSTVEEAGDRGARGHLTGWLCTEQILRVLQSKKRSMSDVNIKPPALGDNHAKTNKGIITTSAGQPSSFVSFLLPSFLALDTVYETHPSLGFHISNLPNHWPFPFNQTLNVRSCLSRANPTQTRLTPAQENQILQQVLSL